MEFIEKVIHALTTIHPIHPMLVHFPIALTGAASFFILLALWQKNPGLEQVAFANMVLATFGTIAAGLTGLMDNIKNYDGGAPNAGTKMILATVLFVITAGTSLVRWRNPDIFKSRSKLVYVGAYFISFGLSITLAFLGGVILYGL